MDKHSLNDLEDFIQELEEKNKYIIDNKNGIAVLTVFDDKKSSGTSDAELYEEIMNKMQLLGVVQINEESVKKSILDKTGLENPVGKWLDGKKENSVIHIEISDDRMRAFMKVSAPKSGGIVPDKSEILGEIYKKGISFGIDEKKIIEWCSNPVYNKELTVAEGELPIAGKNGRILITFLEDKESQPAETDGKIDHREIGFIKNVSKGDILARKIKPEAGKDGKRITGEIIPSVSGKDVDFKSGVNVKVLGDELIAEITGRPVVDKHGIISVDEIIYLDQVDYSTGNIDFSGSIIVEDRIADGFHLKTKGSIIVKKSVGKVFIHAEGDVIIEGGFMGKDEGTIESDSDVYVRFVERGRILSKGSIYVKDAAMHSDLIAAESVYLNQGRGDLIGGETISGQNIIVNKLGAVVETKTRVIVGIQYEIIQMVKEIKNTIGEHEEVLKKIENTAKQLQDQKKKQKEELSEEEKAMEEKLESVRAKYISLLNSAQKQYETTLENFHSSPGTYAQIIKEMYHGVEINFGQSKIYKSPLKPVSGKMYIYRDADNQIITGSTRPKVPVKEEE